MEQQFSDSDGINLGGADGIVKEILDAGRDFNQQLARSRMSFEDGLDYAAIWRTGVTFRLPVIVMHASQAIIASIGEDGLARSEAVDALIGHRQKQANAERKKRGIFPFGGRSSNKSDSPQEVDQQP